MSNPNSIETAAQIASKPTLSKQYIGEVAGEIIESVLEGYANPLAVMAEMKALAQVCEAVTGNDQFQSAVIREIEKGATDYRGAQFSTSSTGAKYDFSGVSEWAEIETSIKELSDRKKKIETALKAQYESGMNLANVNTGEEVQVKKINTGKVTIVTKF